MRRQAVDDFFLKRNPKYFARKSTVPFIQSYHITLVNYLGSMDPYEDRCSQEQEKMRGIKSIYASLFMEAHGVHKANWHRFIEFTFSDQHAICLNSRKREF